MTQKRSAWLPISDEMLVDGGFGTAEQQAAAAARIEARRLKAEQTWKALPLRTRIYWTLRYRWQRWRLDW